MDICDVCQPSDFAYDLKAENPESSALLYEKQSIIFTSIPLPSNNASSVLISRRCIFPTR
jgi:hypothetical protein